VGLKRTSTTDKWKEKGGLLLKEQLDEANFSSWRTDTYLQSRRKIKEED